MAENLESPSTTSPRFGTQIPIDVFRLPSPPRFDPDAGPVTYENVEVAGTSTRRVVHYKVKTDLDRETRPIMVAHFQGCPAFAREVRKGARVMDTSRRSRGIYLDWVTRSKSKYSPCNCGQKIHIAHKQKHRPVGTSESEEGDERTSDIVFLYTLTTGNVSVLDSVTTEETDPWCNCDFGSCWSCGGMFMRHHERSRSERVSWDTDELLAASDALGAALPDPGVRSKDVSTQTHSNGIEEGEKEVEACLPGVQDRADRLGRAWSSDPDVRVARAYANTSGSDHCDMWRSLKWREDHDPRVAMAKKMRALADDMEKMVRREAELLRAKRRLGRAPSLDLVGGRDVGGGDVEGGVTVEWQYIPYIDSTNWGPRLHVGDHSVEGDGLVPAKPVVADEKVGQRLVAHMADVIRENAAAVDVQPANVTVTTTLSQANMAGPDNVQGFNTVFVRTTAAIRQAAHDVVWPRAYEEDDPKASLAENYTASPGVVDCRRVANALPSTRIVGNRIAQGVAAALLDCTAREDTSSLYGTLWLAFFDILARGANAGAPTPAVGDIPVLQVGGNVVNEQQAISQMVDDITRRVFVFFSNDLSDSNWNVLRYAAHGLPATVAPAGAVVHSVGEMIHTPPIPMTVYTHDARAAPPVVAPTPVEIMACIRMLANTRGEDTMMVRGFVRAATLFAGIDTQYMNNNVPAAPVTAHMTSIGEVNSSAWPRPQDSNWMWRALNIAPDPPHMEQFAEDARALHELDVNTVHRVAFAVAALLGVAVGVVWHYFSLTGAALLGAVCPGAAVTHNAANTVDRMIKCDHLGQTVPAVMSMACGVVGKLGHWSVNPTSFRSLGWCNGGMATPGNMGAGANSWWGFNDPNTIPYVADPLSCSFMYEHYLDIWGVFQSNVSMDITHELVKTGPAQEQRWWSNEGSKLYKEHSMTAAFINVPYGACALNALLQYTNAPAMWAINWEMYVRLEDTSNLRPLVGAVVPVPVYIPAIHIIQPKSMYTFSWVDMVVLVPTVTAVNFGAAIWSMLARMVCKFSSVQMGVHTPQLAPTASMLPAFDSLSSFIDGLDLLGTTSSSATAKKIEREGDAGE
nr:hypothetical protein [Mute swan feces associated toti-like virus 1]